MRKFWLAAVLTLGGLFFIANLAEVESSAKTLARGDWRFLGLGLVVQFVWLVNIAASYRAIYRALGMQEDIPPLLIQTIVATFVNTVTPSVGMGGMTIFITEGKKRGHPSARVALASVLYAFFDYCGFLCVLVLGLAILIRRNNISLTEITASAILLGIATVIGLILYQGMKSAAAMGRVLVWLVRLANRLLRPFIKRDYLSERRAVEFANDAGGGFQEIRANPANLAWPAALSLSNKALMVTLFFLTFVAFKVPYSPGTLIAGYSIGYLFTLVSPTPAGIGVVEGVLTLALRSLYVPLGSAAVITLAYRGLTFWLPLLYGVAAIRLLGGSGGAGHLPQGDASSAAGNSHKQS